MHEGLEQDQERCRWGPSGGERRRTAVGTGRVEGAPEAWWRAPGRGHWCPRAEHVGARARDRVEPATGSTGRSRAGVSVPRVRRARARSDLHSAWDPCDRVARTRGR